MHACALSSEVTALEVKPLVFTTLLPVPLPVPFPAGYYHTSISHLGLPDNAQPGVSTCIAKCHECATLIHHIEMELHRLHNYALHHTLLCSLFTVCYNAKLILSPQKTCAVRILPRTLINNVRYIIRYSKLGGCETVYTVRSKAEKTRLGVHHTHVRQRR